MSEPLVIGVDVGSQGACAQALEPDGTLVASAYAAHDLSYPRAGWAEQDCDDWLRSLVTTLSEVREATEGRAIAALSFGSQLDGLVATNADGDVLHPALIWCDRRAGAECDEVAARTDPAELRALTGCNIDPSHVGPKIAWLARNRPDLAPAWLLLPGSYVAWRASGVLAVDPSNASSTGLLDPRTRAWAPAACEAYGVDAAKLAPVLPAHAPLGPIAPWLRDATGLSPDTLVVLGCGDEMAATLGAGVVEPGVVCDVLGTAEPVCAVVSAPVHDPSGVAELHPHADPDTWLLENPGWLSGGAYRWLRDELGSPEIALAQSTGADVYDLLNALAEKAPPGADGVVWVPALAGAMAPEWNPHARAAWFGLTAAHGRAHLTRAVIEGNALALRDVIEAIGAAGADRPREIVCVGGGARGRLLLEVRANVTGLPVSRPDDVETTARGAAMLAAVGAGLHPTVAEAGRAMAGPRAAAVAPDPPRKAIYDDLHGRYRQIYAALSPLFATLPV
ncbi:MAG TPA: FGGY family carbohydrate kinase [Solirubrobacter sp.]|nr:FGGY family carbohydrate kinase [Solirubrobacter sp.]